MNGNIDIVMLENMMMFYGVQGVYKAFGAKVLKNVEKWYKLNDINFDNKFERMQEVLR